MFPKCLVFSDINIFIRTYSSRFLVFPISRFSRANTQWGYQALFSQRSEGGDLSSGMKPPPWCPLCPCHTGKRTSTHSFLEIGFQVDGVGLDLLCS